MTALLIVLALGWLSAEVRVREERRDARAWRRIAKGWRRAAKLEGRRADEVIDAYLEDTQDPTDAFATN
jgi:ribosomal protein S7